MTSALSERDKKLVEKALEVSKKAYAPYSRFYVGSALETGAGNVFVGCNVENASYGVANCAERTAIFTAVAQEGPGMTIKTIVALCQNAQGEVVDGCCCGVCRQAISEFASPETRVIYQFGGKIIVKPFAAILPDAFTKSSLEF